MIGARWCRASTRWLAAVLVPGAFIAGGCGGAAPARTTATTLVLGAQTHFSQGWPAAHLDLARAAGAPALRDAVPWSRVERVRGRYVLDGPALAPLDRFCRRGGGLLLTTVPLHPFYDGGLALRSAEAKAAFVRYVLALQAHFGPCLIAIEVGNEINAPRSRQIYRRGETGGDEQSDPLRDYVELVRATRDALRARGASTRVLGGSSNTIATGFLESLFARGLLDAADGLAVHPYRPQADNLDTELSHLQDVMKRHGRPLPIWASEFGGAYRARESAAPQLVKTATLLAAARVEAAYWYALVEQGWLHDSGLYTTKGMQKPALGAFRLLQRVLLPRGAPERVELADANVRLYRFGRDGWVAWGASGRLDFGAGARLFDAQGKPIARNTAILTDEPVIALAPRVPTLAPGPVVADSLLGYGGADWRYLARLPDGSQRELHWIDGRWTSRRGDPALAPLWVADGAGAPAGRAADGRSVIVRYQAPRAASVAVALCLETRAGGDGVAIALRQGARELASTIVTGPGRITLRAVPLAAGDHLDLIAGPDAGPGSNGFRYRIRIAAEPHVPSMRCPARAAQS
ncbi:hypothetical protein [Novosphingobium soli]|uniref:Asl1-like glycosyl hydrolase catalytic domain-containing protein n=1 Tax=Novosphingobium soli TaxID=574956 RepID=A0ABV6CY05_9SPHN